MKNSKKATPGYHYTTGVGINMRHIPQWILHTVGYNTTEGPPPLSLSIILAALFRPTGVGSRLET